MVRRGRRRRGARGSVYLPQGDNLGFAAGNNAAARVARGQWLALINPDAFATPDWLERLLDGAARHPQVRCFGSLQLRADDEAILDGAGDVMTIAGIPYRGGYGLPRRPIPEGEIFSACGAAMLIARALFLDHGGFDERFFCYCEDVDLGYRLRRAGERVMMVPDAIVAHIGGGSSGPRSVFATFHGARNRVWTYVKNTPPLLFWLSLPAHIAITLMLIALASRRGLALTTARGAWAGIAGAGQFWARAAQPPRRKRDDHARDGEEPSGVRGERGGGAGGALSSYDRLGRGVVVILIRQKDLFNQPNDRLS